jgi:hypothetical protein
VISAKVKDVDFTRAGVMIQSDLINFSLGVNDTSGIRYGPQPGVDPYVLPVILPCSSIPREKYLVPARCLDRRVISAKVKDVDFTTRRVDYLGLVEVNQ